MLGEGEGMLLLWGYSCMLVGLVIFDFEVRLRDFEWVLKMGTYRMLECSRLERRSSTRL